MLVLRKVKEHYTVTQHKPAVRWVRKTVGSCCTGYTRTSIPEHYMKKVLVHKTRNRYVPSTKLKTVYDYKVVDVPASKVVEYESFKTVTVKVIKAVQLSRLRAIRNTTCNA